MSRLALKKGEKADELRRLKDKSRKTQAFLSESKKVTSGTMTKGTNEGTHSPERSMKQTVVSGQGSVSGGSGTSAIVIDLLLFGQSANLKKGMSMTQSFQNTTLSGSSGPVNQVMPLKYILKHCMLTTFEISYTNADGTRRTETQMQEEAAEKGKAKKVPGP